MGKKKPPSQRSERQLDDVAKAMARAREEEKKEKSAEATKTERDREASRSFGGRPEAHKAINRQLAPTSTSTKRIKSGDG